MKRNLNHQSNPSNHHIHQNRYHSRLKPRHRQQKPHHHQQKPRRPHQHGNQRLLILQHPPKLLPETGPPTDHMENASQPTQGQADTRVRLKVRRLAPSLPLRGDRNAQVHKQKPCQINPTFQSLCRNRKLLGEGSKKNGARPLVLVPSQTRINWIIVNQCPQPPMSAIPLGRNL